jgi:D-alanine-D-alanine ligase
MTTNKKRIAVLMGGASLEHEVSLRSGQGVVGALTESGFEPVQILLRKDSTWQFPQGSSVPIGTAIGQLLSLDPACVFIALHGPNGEDGRMQGLLDCLNLPYTGSGCAASALSIDKIRAKAVVKAAGISTALHFVLEHNVWTTHHKAVMNRVEDEIGLPAVIKAPSQGSSCGMAIPKNEHEFVRDMDEIMPIENVVMVEQYVKGLEVTCAVLDLKTQERAQALPVTEIRPDTSKFFDYYSKYTPGACQEITPARIGEHLASSVQEAALAAHKALGCNGWSRSDFIINESGPVWLEVNTVPGLTATSLFPQAAAVAGISYNELITLLVEDAIQRASDKQEKEEV